MYRRYYPRYNGYDQEPQRPIGEEAIQPENIETHPQQNTTEPAEPEIIIPEKPKQHDGAALTAPSNTTPVPTLRPKLAGFFSRFGIDDILLLVLIFLFLQEEVEDEGFLLILLFLFLVGL